MLFTCASCKTDASYLVSDYVHDLAELSGIGSGLEEDQQLAELVSWGVLDDEDRQKLDYPLTVGFLAESIGRLLEQEEGQAYLVSCGWLAPAAKADDRCQREEALKIIGLACEELNTIDGYKAEYSYADQVKTQDDDLKEGDIFFDGDTCRRVVSVNDDGVVFEEAEPEEIFDQLEISASYDADLSQAQIIPYGEKVGNSSYVNEYYQLLAEKSDVYEIGGFRFSYSLSSSGIDIDVRKNVKALDLHGRLSISNLHPSIRWTYKENDLKNALLSIKMRASEELGVTDERYGDYRMKFNELDASSFKTLLGSLFDPVSDNSEAAIPICKIKLPVADIPGLTLDLDVIMKLSASGQIHITAYNSFELGFETRKGQMRIIKAIDNDLDAIVEANGKAGFAVDVGLCAASSCLADIQVDAGVKGRVDTTLHLYGKDGDVGHHPSNAAYSTAAGLADGNEDVKVCGDVSLYRYLDLTFNTARSKMAKMGLSRTFTIFDEDDQLFGGLHHIENGHFVKECTRKARTQLMEMDKIIADKIVPETHNKVLQVGESFEIAVTALPEGYELKDLRYASEDGNIAQANGKTVSASSSGAVRIRIFTADEKYEAYVNVLVSAS